MPPDLKWLKDILDNFSPTLQAVAYLLAAAGGAYGLYRRIPRRNMRPTAEDIQQLTTKVRAVLEQPTIATRSMSFGSMIERDLFLELSLVPTGSAHDQTPTDVTLLQRKLMDNDLRLCVVAPSSRGKSTMARKLFCDLAIPWTEQSARLVPSNPGGKFPILFDFSSGTLPVGDDTFNSFLSSADRTSPALLVVDGLDEAYYSGGINSVNEILGKMKPSDSIIAFCRPSTYHDYITHSCPITFDEYYSIESYRPEQLLAYGSLLQSAEPATIVVEGVASGVLQTPLHIAMALAAQGDGTSAPMTHINIDALYEGYIYSILSRESAKPGYALTAEEVFAILLELGGAAVRGSLPLRTFRSPGAVFRYDDFFHSIEKVIGPQRVASGGKGLIESVILRSIFMPVRAHAASEWTLLHPTFCDFMVARYLARTMQTNADSISAAFSRVFSSEVYDFLKSFLFDDTNKAHLAKIRSVCQPILIEKAAQALPGTENEIVLEQVAHLLAYSRNLAVTSCLRAVAQSTQSALIKRGIAIGVAFSGDLSDLESYVATLRSELNSVGYGHLNRLNFSHQLAYFGDLDTIPNGDQDELVDMRVAAATISKLVRQLGTPMHYPSRLLDLYSLECIVSFAMASPSVAELVEGALPSMLGIWEHQDAVQSDSVRTAYDSLKSRLEAFAKTKENVMKSSMPLVSRKDDTSAIRIDAAMELFRMTDSAASSTVDFVWATLDGVHTKRTNRKSTKIYAVSSGEVDVVAGTAPLTTLKIGDVCVVPPGVSCELHGRKALIGIICSPAFDPSDEIVDG
jgi:hypothetical protein